MLDEISVLTPLSSSPSSFLLWSAPSQDISETRKRWVTFTCLWQVWCRVGGAESHLQLVIVRLAAAVCLLRCLFVGVKQEADTAVITHLHMFNTCTNTMLIKCFLMTKIICLFFRFSHRQKTKQKKTRKAKIK